MGCLEFEPNVPLKNVAIDKSFKTFDSGKRVLVGSEAVGSDDEASWDVMDTCS